MGRKRAASDIVSCILQGIENKGRAVIVRIPAPVVLAVSVGIVICNADSPSHVINSRSLAGGHDLRIILLRVPSALSGFGTVPAAFPAAAEQHGRLERAGSLHELPLLRSMAVPPFVS